jgi:hypothetical protein
MRIWKCELKLDEKQHIFVLNKITDFKKNFIKCCGWNEKTAGGVVMKRGSIVFS